MRLQSSHTVLLFSLSFAHSLLFNAYNVQWSSAMSEQWPQTYCKRNPGSLFFFWGWKSIKFCSGWVIHKISYILFFEDGTKDRMTSQQQLKTAAVKEKKILDVNNFEQSRILDNVLKHLWLYQLVQLYWSPWKLGENGCNYRNIFVHPLKLRLCSSAVTCFILNLLRWHIKTNILTVGSVSKHLST